MSKPSLKVLSFKERAYEKVARFIDDPSSLSELTYSRYKRIRARSEYHSAEYHKERDRRLKIEHFGRRHKKHVMHAQHRRNCVNVLNLLLLRLDLATLECLMVAPQYKIRRPLYIVEIAKYCGIGIRAVQNCLLSLTLAGYIRRAKDKSAKRISKRNKVEHLHRIFLTPLFFRDIQCNIALGLLQGHLLGLSKKAAFDKSKKPAPSHQGTTGHAAHNVFDQKPESKAGTDKETLKKVGNAFLDKMRRKRSKPPD